MRGWGVSVLAIMIALYLGLRAVQAQVRILAQDATLCTVEEEDDDDDPDDDPDPDDDGEDIPEDDASKRPALTVVHGRAA